MGRVGEQAHGFRAGGSVKCRLVDRAGAAGAPWRYSCCSPWLAATRAPGNQRVLGGSYNVPGHGGRQLQGGRGGTQGGHTSSCSPALHIPPKSECWLRALYMCRTNVRVVQPTPSRCATHYEQGKPLYSCNYIIRYNPDRIQSLAMGGVPLRPRWPPWWSASSSRRLPAGCHGSTASLAPATIEASSYCISSLRHQALPRAAWPWLTYAKRRPPVAAAGARPPTRRGHAQQACMCP